MVLVKEAKKIEEAFKSGSAYRVIGLFVKVLSKRIGRKLMVSPYPYNYMTSEGKFSSFYCMFPDGKKALRINFAIKDSDVIHSVDFFKMPSRNPDLKIYLDGLNIIQILTTVVDAVKGHIEDYSESIIKEARIIPADIELERWFNDNISGRDLQKVKGLQLASMYDTWCVQNGKIPAKSAYRKILDIVKNLALQNPSVIPQGISLGRVEMTAPLDRPLMSSAESDYFSEVQNEANDHLLKYDMLTHYLKIISSKNTPNIVNGLVIFGKAGMGKTTTVMPVLKQLGTSYAKYTGKVKGVTGLYQLLWKHSSSDIVDVIIFDDCDSVLSGEGVQMLKGAMDDKPQEERIINYTSAKVGESHIREIEDDDLTADNEPVTTADFGLPVHSTTSIAPSKAPDSFEVIPKVIFISNLKQFPDPIISRCLSVNFVFTEDQVYDMIEASVDKLLDASKREQQANSAPGMDFRPVTREGILEVIAFCRSLRAGVDAIDFRQIKFAITIWASCADDSYKRWVRMHFRRI